MTMTLDSPTEHEIAFILRKRIRLRILHPKVFRKLNDLRGIHSDIKDNVLKEFTKWAKREYQITAFESLLYYNYIQCIADYTSPSFHSISDMLEREGYIDKSMMSRFYDRFDGIRWVLSFRLTKTVYQYKIGEIEL